MTTPPVYEADDPFGARHVMNAIMHLSLGSNPETPPGSITFRFVVQADGRVSQARIIKGSTGYDSLFLKAVGQMHRWTPGMKDGVPVNTEMFIPVSCLKWE